MRARSTATSANSTATKNAVAEDEQDDGQQLQRQWRSLQLAIVGLVP